MSVGANCVRPFTEYKTEAGEHSSPLREMFVMKYIEYLNSKKRSVI